MGMAEIQGLLLALSFLGILLIGSIAVVVIGASMIVVLVKLLKKLDRERSE